MVFRFSNYDVVYQNTRHLYILGIKGLGLGYIFNLSKNNTAVSLCRHSQVQRFQEQRFFIHGHIAVFVADGTANHCHINIKGVIVQILFPMEIDQFNHIILGDIIDFAALPAGVDVCAKSHFRNYTDFTASHLPV